MFNTMKMKPLWMRRNNFTTKKCILHVWKKKYIYIPWKKEEEEEKFRYMPL